MAYFLKKTINKKGTYLQIYSSFYDPERGHTATDFCFNVFDMMSALVYARLVHPCSKEW